MIRILWAEDRPGLFKTCAKTLRLHLESRKLTCEILNVTDGDAIYRLLATEAFDLLIADIEMSRWGGIAAVDSLAKLHPEIPKIIISDHTTDSNVVPILRRLVDEGALQAYFPREPREPWCFACYEALKAEVRFPPLAITKAKVFVVHGHDLQARSELEVLIRRLNLEPVILAATAGSGLTIIEALERDIVNARTRAHFGIALLTPDDFGHAIRDGARGRKYRARQNVILETGMLIAALGRKNVVLIIKGSVERPSDVEGLIYLQFNDRVDEVASKLVDRLLDAGLELSPQAVARVNI